MGCSASKTSKKFLTYIPDFTSTKVFDIQAELNYIDNFFSNGYRKGIVVLVESNELRKRRVSKSE